MNLRKRKKQGNVEKEPKCSNCFACAKGSEYCYLTEKEEKKEPKSKEVNKFAKI